MVQPSPVQKIDIFSSQYPTQDSNNITVDFTDNGGIKLDSNTNYAIALKSASVPNSNNNIFTASTASAAGYSQNNLFKYVTRGVPISSFSAVGTPAANQRTFYFVNTFNADFTSGTISAGDKITFMSVTDVDGAAVSPDPNVECTVVSVDLAVSGLSSIVVNVTTDIGDTSTWPTSFGGGLITMYTAGERLDVTRNIEFPASYMSVDDMFEYLLDQFVTAGFYLTADGIYRYYVNFSYYHPTTSIYILLSNNTLFDVDISDTGSIAPLWGFNRSLYSGASASSFVSQNIVDITNGITTMLVNCNLTFSTYSGNQPSHSIYSYSPGLHGAANDISVATLDWIPIIPSERISSLNVYITDNKGRRVDFNGEYAYYGLVLSAIGQKEKRLAERDYIMTNNRKRRIN